MLNLSLITARITALCPSVGQVILPDLEDVQSTDTAVALLAIADTVSSNRTYPSVLPDDVTYPAILYQLTGGERIDADGYPVVRFDSYDIHVLADTHLAVSTAAKTLRGALQDYSPSGAAGSIDILSESDDYDPDLELFVRQLSVQITQLARTTQTIPAVFVYPIGESFNPGDSFGCVTGITQSRFVVLFAAKIPASGVSGLAALRDEILDAVVAYQPSGWSLIEPEGGGVYSIGSNIVLWRDVFSTSRELTYT